MQSEQHIIDEDVESQVDDKNITVKDKVGRCLRKVSLGKYKPALYFENWDHYSTYFSGIVTILCVGIIMSYAIVILNSIISKSVNEFVQVGRPIEHNILNRFDNGTTFFESYCLNTDKDSCEKFTIQDSLDTFFRNFTCQLNIASPKDFNCSAMAAFQILHYYTPSIKAPLMNRTVTQQYSAQSEATICWY